MSTMPWTAESVPTRAFNVVGSGDARPLHRLKMVRHQQGVTLRRVSRALRIDMHEARVQEDEHTDLNLSTLYAWQEVLDVPVADLLIESPELSPQVLQRSRLLKLMKTAAAIREETDNPGVRKLAELMMEQLIELMPELKDVSPWHLVSGRRRVREYGRSVERPVPDNLFEGY